MTDRRDDSQRPHRGRPRVVQVGETEVCECVGDAVGGEYGPQPVTGCGSGGDRVVHCGRFGLGDPVPAVDVAARVLALLHLFQQRRGGLSRWLW